MLRIMFMNVTSPVIILTALSQQTPVIYNYVLHIFIAVMMNFIDSKKKL